MKPLLGAKVCFTTFIIAGVLFSTSIASSSIVKKVPEFKVALLGDTESGEAFGKVLALTVAEKSDLIMINGDLGYSTSAAKWLERVTNSIDYDSVPIIGTLGNHDVLFERSKYISIFQSLRTKANRLATYCTGSDTLQQGQDVTAVDEVCTFGNISIIGSGIGQAFNTTYLESRLESKLNSAPKENWKLVGYHFTLGSMNPGLKGDENTYRFFDLIRQAGAIGAQAHTHSAMGSCPISSPFAKGLAVQCHPDFGSDLEQRFTAPGTGIFLDSSLSGKGARSRGRCFTGLESGCAHMVDLVSSEGYSRIDGIRKTNFNRIGAMFIVFNSGNDPRKALVYFKSIDGQEVFRFSITK